MTSSMACYCVEKLIREEWELLLKSCKSVEELRRCREMLEMLQHAWGESPYPWGIDKVRYKNVKSLSKLLAGEQVRLWVLRKALEQIVDWVP
jgi:hypothetical protein